MKSLNSKKNNRTLPCGRKIEGHFSKENRKDQLIKKLDLYVRLQGLKASNSRNQILDVLCRQTSHFSAFELIQAVQKKYPSVGQATVYRSFQVFLAAGILRETLTNEKGETIYEVESEEHHDHIVCLDCQSIFEFHDETIEKFQDRLARDQKFKIHTHKHVIYARCDLFVEK